MNLYRATASVIVFTEVLTSTRPHQNVASLSATPSKTDTYSPVDRRRVSAAAEKPLSVPIVGAKL